MSLELLELCGTCHCEFPSWDLNDVGDCPDCQEEWSDRMIAKLRAAGNTKRCRVCTWLVKEVDQYGWCKACRQRACIVAPIEGGSANV